MKIQGNTCNIHKCDICNKLIKKWEQQILVRRWYTPGKNFDKQSSDINMHLKKITELCPECMEALENSLKEKMKKGE